MNPFTNWSLLGVAMVCVAVSFILLQIDEPQPPSQTVRLSVNKNGNYLLEMGGRDVYVVQDKANKLHFFLFDSIASRELTPEVLK